jgi:hypothetical protein
VAWNLDTGAQAAWPGTVPPSPNLLLCSPAGPIAAPIHDLTAPPWHIVWDIPFNIEVGRLHSGSSF